MKFRYRITIGNVVFLIIITFSIFLLLTSFEPNDIIGARYILFFSPLILIGDLFLQWLIENDKKLFVIEGTVLVISLIIFVISSIN